MLCAAGMAILAAAPPAEAVDLSLKTIRVGNLARAYFSERGNIGKPQPLIIALHAGGSSGSLLARHTGLAEVAEAAGYMIAFPNGTGLAIDARTWNSGDCCGYAQMHKVDDVAFIRTLIDKLAADGLADRNRVYLAGMSNGGMMAYRLAAEAPGLFRAIAVVSGTLDVPPETVKAPMPVLHIHGSDDPLIPFLGGIGRRELTQQPRQSVARSIDTFVKANGADPKPEVKDIPDTAGDGTTVRQYSYHTKTDAQSVVLYEVKGGGHNWPGGTAPLPDSGTVSQNLDASRLIVGFFNRHGGARGTWEEHESGAGQPPGTAPLKPDASASPTR